MSEANAKKSESVAVRIAGHEYKIRSDGDADGLREIAGYVDRAMNRVQKRTGTVDTLDVAVLTCLNLAREILALRETRLPEGATTVDEIKLQGLIEQVEGALGLEAAGPEAEGSRADGDAESVRGNATEKSDAQSGSGRPARTLELPSVESLRDRSSASASEASVPADSHSGSHSGSHSDSHSDSEMPEARVASGGRDRAS